MKRMIKSILTCALTALPFFAQAYDSDAIPDDQFIYSYDEMRNFDVAAYLEEHAPHLKDQADVITHWAGYSTVSPKVLMTLIEMQSGLLSHGGRQFAAMQQPMGELSSESGFNAQVQDIATRLATNYYKTVGQEQQNLSFVGQGIATQSLSDELRNSSDGDVEEFQEVYHRLFPETAQSATASTAPSLNRFAAYTRNAVPPDNLLQLPFPVGEQWYFGGAHTYTGSGSYPLSSLDLNNGGYWGSNTSNKWAVASAGGTAIRHSSCFVEVLHEGGWSTTYYHLDNIQFQNRATVSRNQKLANYANNQSQALCDGGSSTGPHQHFSLKYNGSYFHLDGVALSGYKVKTGRWSYDGDCNYFWLSKDNYRYCANRSLSNPGVPNGGDPDDGGDDDNGGDDSGDDNNSETTLRNGQTVQNMSANKEDLNYYVLDVPAGSRNLYFKISGGRGDVDMYVKRDGRPGFNNYNCRPYTTTQDEQCYYRTPQAGKYYIMLHAFSNYSGISLQVGYENDNDQGSNREMSNGQVYRNLSGAQGEKSYFRLNVPAGATDLRIEMSGGTGDADMHVMYQSQPTLSNYHCRPYSTTQVEWCSWRYPYAGTFHIMLYAFKPYSGIQLVATYKTGSGARASMNLTEHMEE
ncbi:pre-peptidase C-terminal domain-containing protein [Hahella sp. CR1]|uniref:pre-peptidase C-terminal domain-containing protein n=1 Tax=Hahella sp. CR1 TaxID=2992807 RepID=UPI002441D6B8|nr:pre-peptidase C-terminal domain-containing protein [Hahella sp. CR1]MDG9669358.1 pre-peptidase C-terminal domain-containing protein [Hahella sp. CR1]